MESALGLGEAGPAAGAGVLAGLDPAGARALLLEGFVMDLWDGAQDGDAIRKAARTALHKVVA